MNISIILKCEGIIRELANRVADKVDGEIFTVGIIKKLKFDNQNGWNILCSLMDVLSDTELAKKSFLKFGLGGPTKIQDYGEQYLRLYGITNAIYLQKSAVFAFIELIKLPNKKKEIERINKCKLIEFRNIVGAHTVDYIDNGTINPHQFQRAFIDKDPIRTSDSNNIFKDYNLEEMLTEFNDIIEDILIKATEKFVKTVYKNDGVKKEKMLEKIDALRTIQNGGMVIWPDNDKNLFIIKIKNVSKH